MKERYSKILLSFALLAASLSLLYLGVSHYVHDLVDELIIPVAKVDDTPEPFFYNKIGLTTEIKKVAPIPVGDQFTVEVSRFQSKKRAQAMVKKLSIQGVDCYYTPMNHKGQVWYHVRSGIYKTKTVASKQANFLKQEFQLKGQILKL